MPRVKSRARTRVRAVKCALCVRMPACVCVCVSRGCWAICDILRHDWFHAHGVPCVSSGEDVALAEWRIHSCSDSRAALNAAKILLQVCHSCCLEPPWCWQSVFSYTTKTLRFIYLFSTLSCVTRATDRPRLWFKSTFDFSVCWRQSEILTESEPLGSLWSSSLRIACSDVGVLAFKVFFEGISSPTMT